MTTYVSDMTQGNEAKLLIRFTLPMIFGNIFQQLYNWVDSIIVGNYLGADPLSAIGVTGSINYLFFAFTFGLSTGAGILVSQYFGAKKKNEVQKSILSCAYITLIAGFIFGLLGVIVADPVLRLMGTDPDLLPDAISYMQIYTGGTLAVAAYNVISAFMRALGDSKTPLVFLIIASLINVGLDLLFIIVFKWGVSGAAWATVISQGVSAVGCIIFCFIKNPYFKFNKKQFKPDLFLIKRCIQIGLPVAAQNIMIAISCIVLQSVANSYGKIAAGAYSIADKIEQVVHQPFNSLGAAVATFTGQNMGAEKIERVKKGYHRATIITIIYAISALLLAWIGGAYVMRIFVKDNSIIQMGATALRITSSMYIPLGMIYITRGLLNGAGDAVYAMVNGLVEVCGRVGFSLILSQVSILGVWCIWFTTGFTWVITATASIIRYRQGKWQENRFTENKKKTYKKPKLLFHKI